MNVFSGGKRVLVFLSLGLLFIGLLSTVGAKDAKKEGSSIDDLLSHAYLQNGSTGADTPSSHMPSDDIAKRGLLDEHLPVVSEAAGQNKPAGVIPTGVITDGAAIADTPSTTDPDEEEIEFLENNISEANLTEINRTQMNVSDLNVTDLDADLNGSDLNWSDINETDLNESDLNWSDINETAFDDPSTNDTDIDDVFLNETLMDGPIILENETWENEVEPPSGPFLYVYAHGDLIAKVRDEQVDYYLSDSLNSVRFVVDQKGKVSSSSSFYPFGKKLETKSFASGGSRFGFTGKETDASLSYFGARYYDPRTAQFVSVDPLYRPELSTYEYARGNPLKLIDPDGRSPKYPQSMAAEPLPMNENLFKWNQALLSGGMRVDGIYIRDPATMQLYYGYAPLPKAAGWAGVGLMLYYNALYVYNNAHADGAGKHIPLDVEELSLTQRDNRVRNQFFEGQGLDLGAHINIRRNLGDTRVPPRYFDGNSYPLTGVEVAYLVATIDNSHDFRNFLYYVGGNRVMSLGENEAGQELYGAVGDDGSAFPITADLYQTYQQKLEWYDDDNWPLPPRHSVPQDSSSAPADAIGVAVEEMR